MIPARDPRSRRPLDWAALLEDPALVAALPSEALAQAYARVAALEAALRAALLTRRPEGAEPPAEQDRALRLEDAAPRLGMSPDYLYRHWSTLGGYKDVDGHVKFTVSAIRRHLAKGGRRA
jgi:hypothetical protein